MIAEDCYGKSKRPRTNIFIKTLSPFAGGIPRLSTLIFMPRPKFF